MHSLGLTACFGIVSRFFPQGVMDFLTDYWVFDINLAQWIDLVVLFVLAYIGGAILQDILVRIAKTVVMKTRNSWDDELIGIFPGPGRLFLSLLLFQLFLPLIDLQAETQSYVAAAVEIVVIFAVAWLALRFVRFGGKYLESTLSEGRSPAEARGVHTQVTVISGIVRFVVIVLGIALSLMQFEVVRSLGMSLLASAGIAGIMIGFAARSAIANLFAGIQLAFAQPIRLGDVVVVEGEWGRIEEITLTFVIVRIWDKRRLILPVSYFLEKPFENWTTVSPDVLGTIYLYTDYTVPIEDIRQELKRILSATDLWDKEASGALVTDMKEQTVQVRLLISAADPSKQWDLRCLVREKMLTWLQNREQHMPTMRVRLAQNAEKKD